MKIEINPALEEKLLSESAQLGMSPTQLINFLVQNLSVEPPKIEPIVLRLGRVKVKSEYWKDVSK